MFTFLLLGYVRGSVLHMYSNANNWDVDLFCYTILAHSSNAVTDFPFSHLMPERQHCAIWIKKLCDPTTCGSGVMDRKNRNMYAHLLLSMLKRGILEGPFTAKPEPGKLKTLPTYMV